MNIPSDYAYEMYGPIMIRNGFLRDSEGNWTTISGIQRLEIHQLKIGGDQGNWGIFIIDNNRPTFSFFNCKERNVAQQYLDHIINGGVIRYEDKIPIMAMK